MIDIFAPICSIGLNFHLAFLEVHFTDDFAVNRVPVRYLCSLCMQDLGHGAALGSTPPLILDDGRVLVSDYTRSELLVRLVLEHALFFVLVVVGVAGALVHLNKLHAGDGIRLFKPVSVCPDLVSRVRVRIQPGRQAEMLLVFALTLSVAKTMSSLARCGHL